MTTADGSDTVGCTSCGKVISRFAKACPDCGLPATMRGVTPLDSSSTRLFFVVVPAVVFVAALLLHTWLRGVLWTGRNAKPNYTSTVALFVIGMASLATVVAYYAALTDLLALRRRLPRTVPLQLFSKWSFRLVLVAATLPVYLFDALHHQPQYNPAIGEAAMVFFYILIVSLLPAVGIVELVGRLPPLFAILTCPECRHKFQLEAV